MTKVCLVKQVFSDMEFVGWYTTGDAPSPDDVDLHGQVRITMWVVVIPVRESIFVVNSNLQ